MGSIDVVNLANNHSMDFLKQGYRDTIHSLQSQGIVYF
ncbi:MAG: CapA family protein [Thermoanaerobacteraceae bacterium]|nr:CapA family protein [Thermoanaerobacteraceae bacterium]